MYIFIYYSCFISFIVEEVYFNHQRQLQMPLICTCSMCMLSVHILLMSVFISFSCSQQITWDVITELAGLWSFKGGELYTLCSVLWLLLLWSCEFVCSPMFSTSLLWHKNPGIFLFIISKIQGYFFYFERCLKKQRMGTIFFFLDIINTGIQSNNWSNWSKDF